VAAACCAAYHLPLLRLQTFSLTALGRVPGLAYGQGIAAVPVTAVAGTLYLQSELQLKGL